MFRRGGGSCELLSNFLKLGYIGDYMGSIIRLLKGKQRVKTVAHVVSGKCPLQRGCGASQA